MIAPIRNPENKTTSALREARRVVAMLLPPPSEEPTAAPAVPAWQAWLLVGWMAVTTMFFLALMFGDVLHR